MDARLSQEKTRRNPPLAQTVWEEESLALSLLSASSRVVHSAAFVHQSYVRSELMIFFLRNLCFYYKTQFYKTLLTMQDSLSYSTYRTMLNATNTVLNMVTYKKYNYLQYRLLPLLIILIYTATYNTLYGILTLRRQEYFSITHIIKTKFLDCI